MVDRASAVGRSSGQTHRDSVVADPDQPSISYTWTRDTNHLSQPSTTLLALAEFSAHTRWPPPSGARSKRKARVRPSHSKDRPNRCLSSLNTRSTRTSPNLVGRSRESMPGLKLGDGSTLSRKLAHFQHSLSLTMLWTLLIAVSCTSVVSTRLMTSKWSRSMA